MMAIKLASLIDFWKWNGQKKREPHGSLQDSSGEEPPFKDYTKVLNNRGKKSGPINKKNFRAYYGNTFWQQKDKEPPDKLKNEMGTYDPPQSFQKFPIKYCNEEIWNGHLKNKHKQVGLNVSDTKSSILVSSLKESKRKKTQPITTEMAYILPREQYQSLLMS